jgi:hypothetical protein
MRAFSACAVASIVSAIALSSPSDAKAASSVADAKKALESARANLTKAVERIQKDPPANADLDAALAAVEALKVTIDAGAEHEPKDLDYAKAALAARKELRTQREYVEQRRAKVHIHERRREIDRALTSVEEAVQRVLGLGKGAELKDFDGARSAVARVEQELAKGQTFVAQDSNYAGYAKGVTAALTSHRTTLDDQWVKIGVEKHKANVEEKRRALSAAIDALSNKNATDAQFEGADKAMTALAKILDEGKSLEKDSGYRGYAEKAREEIRQAKKKIDALWAEVGVARLKAEIEPAREALAEAGRALRSGKANADQVAEARTAAIVVRKLLEKIQQRTISDAGFAQYLADVKKALLEVDVDLQRRNVDAARESLSAALKATSAANAGEETLKAAIDGIEQVRKVLKEGEAFARANPAYATWAQDVSERLKDAEAGIATRRQDLEYVRQRAAYESARNDLTKALRGIERRGATDEQFDEVKTAIIVLEKTLETERPKDQRLVKYVSDLRTLLKNAKTTMDERRLATDIERHKAKVDQVRSVISTQLKTALTNVVPTEELDALDAALERLKGVLIEGAAFAKKDRAYAEYDREAKKRLEETKERVAKRREELAVLAEKSRIEPTLKELSSALSAMDGFAPKTQAIQAAEKALLEAEGAIAQGAAAEKKLAAYRTWVEGARKAVDTGRTRIAKKKLELSAGDGRNQLEEKLGAAKSGVDAAKQPTASDAEVSGAAESVEALRASLEASAELEGQHQGYASSAAKARKDLDRLLQELELAKQAHALRKAMTGPLTAGNGAADAAASSQDIRTQKQQYEKAIAAFKACQNDGTSLLDENSALASITVLVQGQPNKPKQVIALCASRAEATEPELKKVAGLVAFEDGPKQFFEKAKSSMAQGNKSQALGQFDECISSGRILQHKNPELKERKLPVAGASMTLSELIEQCSAESKRLRPK